ncbi:MAG: cobalt-precorrin-5B (C(1))-methyltransferase [Steroidobacteraceae bacterium]
MTGVSAEDIDLDMANERPLRRGWTTGACATAAAKAAYAGLLTGEFPDPVEIELPGGQRVSFALAETVAGEGIATAGVIKDAGDDPDVTHGALVRASVTHGAPGAGVSFRAGAGVGVVTRPGLPLLPGEPAINPVPRRMIAQALGEVATAAGAPADVIVEIAIPDGEKIAERTLNARLGIIGGLSILGTTGIVTPYSCSAWIFGIRQGIDVARAVGLTHVAGATGRTSEAAVQALYGLPETALIDMGDFVGGMLKHLRDHPIARVSIAGGLAKITKLAQGFLDLHSNRGSADLAALAKLAAAAGAPADLTEHMAGANTVLECFQLADAAGFALGEIIARQARAVAVEVLHGATVDLEVLIFDRQGALTARCGLMEPHVEASERNRRS